MATSATSPEMIPLRLEATPTAPPRRRRMLLMGTAFASAGSAAFFIALLAIYVSVRSQTIVAEGSWLPSGAFIPLSPGNMGMATLAMATVLVQWAVWAAARRDRGHTYMAIGFFLLLGMAHITQIAFLWTDWNLPLNPQASTQAVLLFAILGAHIAMVGAALIFVGLMGLRSLGGQFTGRDVEGLSAAALYWYVTVAVYAVIWYGVLITK